jgi:hypothetical protein
MNASIDCLTSIDAPQDGLSTVRAPAGGLLVLRLDFVKEFAARCPEQYTALIECHAFVNWRRIQRGGTPILALSFWQ